MPFVFQLQRSHNSILTIIIADMHCCEILQYGIQSLWLSVVLSVLGWHLIMFIISMWLHGLNLSGDMACVKPEARFRPVRTAQTPITAPHADAPCTHADIRRRIHPPQCKPPHSDAGRCTTPKPHATHIAAPRTAAATLPLPLQIIIWPTRQRREVAVRRSAVAARPFISHTAALAATHGLWHSYATSLERRHLISKYWFANRRPKTVTYSHKRFADSDLDGLGKNPRIRLRIRNP